ncbi:LuxR C-terminal-related transcriptional regulator [Cupriavidus oxalaticus]|uniref:HTH luxR-type domain-containing protein n=1 Tax=Cupriavidus oxalaticus TaxID=96344 RepID=A0A4P7LI26_9BURK|nr:LuxR C-terminal-related transcriptional regulator [Cupriavidus oxalaticus]QBY55445.1 hypothetical protein E0W60_30830 [Cupriavidus oxalaticus]
MHDDQVLAAQRALRRTLFDGGDAIPWAAARDLAARLLLYLEDPRACWQLTVDWLREQLDADRVDGGFGGYMLSASERRDYTPLAESQRQSLVLHSVLGNCFDAGDPSICTVWHRRGPTAFADVSQQREMTPAMRRDLLHAGTAAKIALPLYDGPRPVGLLCADWHRAEPRWNAEVCNQIGLLGSTLLGPVLAISSHLSALDGEAAPAAALHDLEKLTPAERRVAELVAEGLSYKEVARQLGRSLSTVDHHLRSIRQKLDVGSTARLVRLLAGRQSTKAPA